MIKKITFGSAFILYTAVLGQVGVNTGIPKTTVDINAKRDGSGVITDNSQLIGLQAPRLTRAELTANTASYGADQQGAQIYVTDVSGGTASGQRINIDTVGYYYFDGTLWQKFKNIQNIYTADGSLISNRVLSLNSYQLNYTGSQQKTYWDPTGSISQNNLQSSSGTASMAFYGGNNANLFIQQFYNADAQILIGSNSKSLIIGSNYTSTSAPILFTTSSGSSTPGTEKMRVTGEGSVGINTTSPTEKLDNNGITRLRVLPLSGTANAINTTSAGTASSLQNQTFTATRTVVADANGVLGYLSGLPSTGTAPISSINIGETISRVYSVPTATASVSTFNLKTYVTANSLTALPIVDGLEMNLQGVSSTYYDPRIYNTSSVAQLVSYQSFATIGNENKTSISNNLASNAFVQVDSNNIVFWTTAAAEVETTNLQVQIDANTYRWYEFTWWCMEVSGQKKIFLSVIRKA